MPQQSASIIGDIDIPDSLSESDVQQINALMSKGDAMSPEDVQRINATLTKAYKTDNPKAKQPPVTSWVDTAVSLLPKAGPLVGGAIGSMAGGKLGAAIGGAAGEGYQQLLQHASELPGAAVDVARGMVTHPIATAKGFVQGAAQGAVDAGTEGAKQAALQGIGELAGKGVTAAVNATGLPKLAEPIMRSAMGNTAATMSRSPDVAKIALKAGANVTRGSLHKLDDILAKKTLGLADQAALETTRDAIASAWKKAKPAQLQTAFGAISGHPAFRSAMANGLYNAAAYFGRITPQAIRTIMLGADAVTPSTDEQ